MHDDTDRHVASKRSTGWRGGADCAAGAPAPDGDDPARTGRAGVRRPTPFTDIELRFLNDYAAELGLPSPNHLAAAVLLLAILGGYQNRTHDPPPGHQIMWRGYERISIATIGYRIAQRKRAGIVQNE